MFLRGGCVFIFACTLLLMQVVPLQFGAKGFPGEGPVTPSDSDPQSILQGQLNLARFIKGLHQKPTCKTPSRTPKRPSTSSKKPSASKRSKQAAQASRSYTSTPNPQRTRTPPVTPPVQKEAQAPPRAPAPPQPSSEPHKHGLQAFKLRGCTDQRGFTDPSHQEKFDFLEHSTYPARLSLHKCAPSLASKVRKSRKFFAQNTRRRYCIQHGHLVYKAGSREDRAGTSITSKVVRTMHPNRIIPFNDEEWDIVQRAHGTTEGGCRCVNTMEPFIKTTHMVPHLREIALEVRRRCAQCEEFAPPAKVGTQWILTEYPLQLVMFDLSTLQIQCDDGTALILLLVTDHFTKFKWGRFVSTKHSLPISNYLLKLFRNESTPSRWHCDNGSEFINSDIDKVRKELTKSDNEGLLPYSHGQPRHPQCQGLVERANRTFKDKFSKRHGSWRKSNPDTEFTQEIADEFLDAVLSSVNGDQVKLYKTTPQLLMRGRPLHMANVETLPVDNLAELHVHCKLAQRRQAFPHDTDIANREVYKSYKVGEVVRLSCRDQVMHKKEAPMGKRWPWLATIASQNKKNADYYYLKWIYQGPKSTDRPGIVGKRGYHVTQLKYGTDDERAEHNCIPDPLDNNIDDIIASDDSSPIPENMWEVDKILARRTMEDGSLQYEIQWVGYEDTSWEALSELGECMDAINAFNSLEDARDTGASRQCDSCKSEDHILVYCEVCMLCLCDDDTANTCWRGNSDTATCGDCIELQEMDAHRERLRVRGQIKDRLVRENHERALRENHAALPRIMKAGLRIKYVWLQAGGEIGPDSCFEGTVVEVDAVNKEITIRVDSQVTAQHTLGTEASVTVVRDDGIQYEVLLSECTFEYGSVDGGEQRLYNDVQNVNNELFDTSVRAAVEDLRNEGNPLAEVLEEDARTARRHRRSTEDKGTEDTTSMCTTQQHLPARRRKESEGSCGPGVYSKHRRMCVCCKTSGTSPLVRMPSIGTGKKLCFVTCVRCKQIVCFKEEGVSCWKHSGNFKKPNCKNCDKNEDKFRR
jgi:hypothetical protein